MIVDPGRRPGVLQHRLGLRLVEAGPLRRRGQGEPRAVLHRRDDVVHRRRTRASGEPSQFAAHVVYRRTLNAAPQQKTITVNHPLRLEGDRVYLIGHGFAPQITIHMPDGSVRHDTAAFIPQNATTFLSEGAFKEGGVPGKKQDVGISGFFAPTPATDRGRRDHVGVTAGERPGARHLRLSGRPELQRPAAVGVLARHVEDDASSAPRTCIVGETRPSRTACR